MPTKPLRRRRYSSHGNEARKAAAAYNREEVERKLRTHCTVCGEPKPYYELEPGTGRCDKCMP